MPIAYYNEFDPEAAQWLRNLITRGAIAPGDVDERSIEDVCPDDLRGYTQCHFFAGIGVWSYALRSAGWRDERPVWTGSPPCQPFSEAGASAGFADERHLWPAYFHLINECRPVVFLGEQVDAAIRHAWLDLVQVDVESLGYAFGAVGLPACGFGAPHIRQRIFFVGSKELANPDRERFIAPAGSGLQTDAQHDAESRGDSGGDVANTPAGRRGEERQNPRRESLGDSSERESAGHLHGRPIGTRIVGDTLGAGLEGHAGDVADGHRPGRDQAPADRPATAPGCTNGFWSDADWLPFRDSKIRPVEPGIGPLVDGPTSRVGHGGTVEEQKIEVMLKGYGNAIVAPVAEEFIRAYLGSLT